MRHSLSIAVPTVLVFCGYAGLMLWFPNADAQTAALQNDQTAAVLPFGQPSVAQAADAGSGENSDAAADGTTIAASASGQADAEPALIASVVGRERVVYLFAGQRYSVETVAGDVLATMLSEEEFAAGFPDIHADTQIMLAGPIVADIDLSDELPAPGGASPFDNAPGGR